ncbi:hypothetical protein PV08_00995 [Exophiala spinifera]|uniref:Zinc finger PHD-type domain-containing protein n=1 Tax=Exophiala spinifera TaxID=91928 RepID=A0A0D2BPH3_9EURO|nr:uncharacterized protein PV08_00995 [Exophiala spinifera]KIW20420.1 hypothetical protein PV08_00995 [Exophiala spinifera]
MAGSSKPSSQPAGWVRRSNRATRRPERLGQTREHEQPGTYYPRPDVVRACLEQRVQWELANLADSGPVYPSPQIRNPNIGVHGPFLLHPLDVPATTLPQNTIQSPPAPLTSQNLLSVASDTRHGDEDPRSATVDVESCKDNYVLSSDSSLSSIPETPARRGTCDDPSKTRPAQTAPETSKATATATTTATATFPEGFLQKYKILLSDLAEEIDGLRQNNKLSEVDDEDLEEWCICRMGDVDEEGSVKCDNPSCSVGWYHQGCLNQRDRLLHQQYDLWLCTICLNRRLKALQAKENAAANGQGSNEIEQTEPCFDNYPDDPFVLGASSDIRDTDMTTPPNSPGRNQAIQEVTLSNNAEFEARASQARSPSPSTPSLHCPQHVPGIETPVLPSAGLQSSMHAVVPNTASPRETQRDTETKTRQSTTTSIQQPSAYVPNPSKISLSVMNALSLSLSAKLWTSPASTIVVVEEPGQGSIQVNYKHNLVLPDLNQTDCPRFALVCEDDGGRAHSVEVPVKLLLFFSRTLKHANVDGLCARAPGEVAAVRVPLAPKEPLQHAVDFLKGQFLSVKFGALDTQVATAEKRRLLGLVHVAHALAIEPLMHAAVHALCTAVLRRPDDWADVVANARLLRDTTFPSNPARRLLGSVRRHSILPTVTGWATLASHQEDRDQYCRMPDRTCRLKGSFSPEIRLWLESFDETGVLGDDGSDDDA